MVFFYKDNLEDKNILEEIINQFKCFCFKIPIIFFLIIIIISYKKKVFEEKINDKSDFFLSHNLLPFNKYYLNDYFNISGSFNLTYLKYHYSFKYNIIQIEYSIGFYDLNDNLILPSDFLFIYNYIQVICHINSKSIDIYSLPNIYQNLYFNCIEFIEINEEINFGIILNNQKQDIISSFYFFTEKLLYYNYLVYENNQIFEPIFINMHYSYLLEQFGNIKMNKTLKLKKSFSQYPHNTLKKYVAINDNEWMFKDIYNYYFCFCKGNNCLNKTIPNNCKYNFYQYIIDNNRNVFQKTDYLFMDFIFAELSSDDVYPIFKEMIRQRLPAHYITEKSEIYKDYCNNSDNCLIILPVIKEKNPIHGNFLEKYLTIFLKLKIVVTGRGTTFNTNLFYNIEYITYICVGHGVCFFKYYLYKENRIYGINKNDKILLPPTDKIIDIAKKYGWKDKDIIKMNLPRWDIYNIDENENLLSSNAYNIIKNNSILIMFTWRDIIKSKEISVYYLKNLTDLIFNDILGKEIEKNNITLYLSFHRLINLKYQKKYKDISKKKIYMKYIDQNDISKCLRKTDLVVTDFSSIIFDLIYRRKPYIIYIPDANDPKIKKIYKKDYVELIGSMKNGKIKFENKFFNIKETIDKIIFYIHNKFKIEPKLEDFYDTFGFQNENSINKFIDYIKFL